MSSENNDLGHEPIETIDGQAGTAPPATTGPEASGALVPVPTVAKHDASKRGGVHVGAILERTRRRLGYATETVARELWISKRELDNFEAGLATPPADVTERLAEFYGIDPRRLEPGQGAERVADDQSDHEILYLGWAAVDLSETDGSNVEILSKMASTMRSLRDVHEDAPLTIRGDELAVISSVLDMDDPTVVTDLASTFRLTNREAAELAARLRHASLSRKELPESTGP